MKETISESWTIQLVAAFILLFVAFLALMISYSKVFKSKNEAITIVEKYEGFTSSSIKILNDFLYNTNYKASGHCEVGPNNYGMKTLDDTKLEKVKNGENYKYCVTQFQEIYNKTIHYELTMFYSFNIPALGNIMTFDVKGTTIDLNSKYKLI